MSANEQQGILPLLEKMLCKMHACVCYWICVCLHLRRTSSGDFLDCVCLHGGLCTRQISLPNSQSY